MVMAGGVDVASLHFNVTLVPYRAAASGSVTGYGDSVQDKRGTL